MQNTLDKKALISTLLESKFVEVKSLKLVHEIQISLKETLEGDAHAKKVRLQNWICLFQDAKIQEEETIIGYFCI